MVRNKIILFIILLSLFIIFKPVFADMFYTKHNLSSSGSGEIKSTTETEVCVFCHVPHSAYSKTPLWGHVLSEVKNYSIYTNPSGLLKGRKFVQPDGASRLCLSCHDGTVALGAVVGKRQIEFTGGKERLEPGEAGFIGTDLSGSHPISIEITDSMLSEHNVRGISILKSIKEMKSDRDGVTLDENNKVQCSTCHDPHSDDNYNSSGIHFWRKKDFSNVCEVCHGM